MDTSHSPESFRSLLLRYRGRTGLIQRDLAARSGVSERSVQDWETGVTLPTAPRLRALIQGLLEAGGLTAGQEVSEARELWRAGERDARRMHPPFDEEWFGGLLAAHGTRAPVASLDAVEGAHKTDRTHSRSERAEDWGEAPDTAAFVGRTEELALLQSWILEEHCRLVVVLGMGGIGKTSLAACVAQQVAPEFARVYWRSVRNAPPVGDWLAGAIGFLSDQQLVQPPSDSGRTTALLQLLRDRRCLLVLDNSETLFEPGQRDGRYRAGMEGYGRLLQAVSESAHQSCLLLTSREAPPELMVLGRAVRGLELHGLGIGEAQALLVDKRLSGDAQAWGSLVDQYGGNGLALKIVGETIHQVYDGQIAAFLQDAVGTYGMVFGGIRRLLDAQVERLSPTERDVLTQMAVEREPIKLAELSARLAPSVGRSTVIEAIENLRRRSLVERAEGATFTLQSMVLEYTTDRLVETAADEIVRGNPIALIEHPLIKAVAKDYVRQSQERLIGEPILELLKINHSPAEIELLLLALLDAWRTRSDAEQAYGPGNVVNLLRLLRGDLRGLDLSKLCIRQAYLQEVEAQGASLAATHLINVVLADAFSRPISVALSADGSLLAIGTAGGDVGLWRVADRTSLMAVQGHVGLSRVALSRDGRLLASGGTDGTLKVWDVLDGRLLATLPKHSSAVWAVALNGDGEILASASSDGAIRLWEVPAQRLLATIQGPTGPVHVALSADGHYLVSASSDGVARVWEVPNGRLVTELEGHAGAVHGVALSEDGRLAASGGADRTVKLWEVPGGELVATLESQSGGLRGVALSGDGRLLTSSGYDGIARLWELPDGRQLAALQSRAAAVHVALSGDGRLLATANTDGTARLWEAPTGRLLSVLQGRTDGVWGVALSGDGQLVASGSADGLLRLWNEPNGGPPATLHGHTSMIYDVAMTGDGRMVAGGGWDGAVRLWQTGNRQLLVTLEGHTGPVWGVALTEDGSLLATSSADGTARLWACPSGEPLATLQGHAVPAYCVALSGDGRLVATGGADGIGKVWEASSGQLVATLEGHDGPVHGVSLSGDGSLLASASTDGTARVWEVSSGRLLRTLVGHAGPVYCVALSSDGHVVASGSADGTVKLWEGASGTLLRTLVGHVAAVRGVGLSRDAERVASGGYDGTTRLWSAISGECLRTFSVEARYKQLDITGLTGVTEAQRQSMIVLGAVDEELPVSAG